MAIVLEGPDNSGKSTLAKMLSERTGWEVIHVGGAGSEEDYEMRLLRDIDLMQQPVIMDRSFIVSDTIYGPICRNQRLFDSRPWFRKIQSLDIHDSSFVLVFCTAHPEILLDQSKHIIKPHEPLEHGRQVAANQERLVQAYANLHSACSLFMDCFQVDPRQDGRNFVEDIDLIVNIGDE